MSKKMKPKNIDELLAEADELVKQMDSGAINNLKEEHRLEFGKHAQSLEKIKSDVKSRADNKEASDMGAGGEGMHEAILDIVKAMQNFKSNIF